MMNRVQSLFVAGLVCVGLFVGRVGGQEAEKPPQPPSAEDMAAMMAKMTKYTQPSEHHKMLERFLGKWNSETRITMAGAETPGDKGTSEATWLMEGRWLQSKGTGKMMGMPADLYMIIGYDNFKMSYVVTFISSIGTEMLHAEGDLDQYGKTLIMYGTLDEYLTGEHDKMCKYVWRFESDDKIVFEIHDLSIGEKNTKVVEVVSTRAE